MNKPCCKQGNTTKEREADIELTTYQTLENLRCRTGHGFEFEPLTIARGNGKAEAVEHGLKQNKNNGFFCCTESFGMFNQIELLKRLEELVVVAASGRGGPTPRVKTVGVTQN